MTFIHFLFYLFALTALISATLVVTMRHPVHNVLSLVVTFFSMAGIWMLLHAEFLSLILLLVYVGAVMTLFLFVVMMLNVTKESRSSGFVRYLPIGVALLLIGIGLIAIGEGRRYGFTSLPLSAPWENNNLEQLGMVLYTHYVFAFEVAGVILLAGIIAAITLTERSPRYKTQNSAAQIAKTPQECVRIIKDL